MREIETFDRNGCPKLNKNGTPKMKREYCCNENEYNEYLKSKVDAKAAEAEMWELVTEYVGKTNNTILYSERAKWGEATKVCRLIKENRDKFDYMKTKNFDRMYNKIMYFSAIVKNNIDDLPEIPMETPVSVEVNEVHYINKHKSKLRKGLFEDE